MGTDNVVVPSNAIDENGSELELPMSTSPSVAGTRLGFTFTVAETEVGLEVHVRVVAEMATEL